MTVATVFLVFAAVSFLALVARTFGVLLREERWLPREITSGELMFSEHTFIGPARLPIVAKVDRVYVVNGQLYLVELKARRNGRVLEADIIELSAQRVAVAATTGMEVSRRGFVVIEHPDSHQRTVRIADLLSDEQVAGLVDRRRAILDGLERPMEACAKNRCTRCEYRGECKDATGFKVLLFVRSSSDQDDESDTFRKPE